jgi:lipopolysaccharide/colanic/teichoic acid biosynthesis glycosyltransferase
MSTAHAAATLAPIFPVFRPSERKLKKLLRQANESRAAALAHRLAVGYGIVAPKGNRHPLYLATKRGMDIVGALSLIVLLSPVMVAVFVVLLVTTRGKPFIAKDRIGYRGRKFKMYKFRTMCLDADQRQHLVKNEQSGPVFKNRHDPRITPIGRVLRSFSIDELPQLFNVLKGDMALVGPRPPVEKEVVRYEPWQLDRLSVKPGLTCLWQVSGRCEVGFEDWVRMDLWYVRNQNLLTDLKLLARTPLSVLSRRGAY